MTPSPIPLNKEVLREVREEALKRMRVVVAVVQTEIARSEAK